MKTIQENGPSQKQHFKIKKDLFCKGEEKSCEVKKT